MNYEKIYMIAGALILGASGLFWLVGYFSGNPFAKQAASFVFIFGAFLLALVPFTAILGVYFLEIYERIKRGLKK